MATLKALKPFVPSGPDFDRTKSFFRDLGFTIVWEADGLAELRLGDAAFLLQKIANEELQSNFMLFAAVDDLDAWWEHIRSSGVLEKYGVHAKAPTMFPWGQREVHLIDPAGVCWHFA